MDAQRTEMTTRDGVRVTRTAAPFDPAELGRGAALADGLGGLARARGLDDAGAAGGLACLTCARIACFSYR